MLNQTVEKAFLVSTPSELMIDRALRKPPPHSVKVFFFFSFKKTR